MKKKVILFCFGLFFITIQATAQITSSFGTDADGWTFSDAGTPVTVNYNSTNGNPGGYVSVTYNSNTTVASEGWFAPAKFLGSQVAKAYGMNLKFDLQQAFAGTSSSAQGDVRIEGAAGFDIVFSLPVKPATAPAWSSYSITLDENSGWRVSSTGGALATKADVTRALADIKFLEIRGTYITNASNVSGLDNVILEQKTLGAAPLTTSFTPLSGVPGTNLTITGNNFGATAAQNSVFFGATKATIVSGNATQLVVTIPAGAQQGPITVINLTTGLLNETLKSFTPLFDNNKDFGGPIIPASLTRGYTTLLQNGTETGSSNNQNGNIDAGDLDGDGWVDIIATETGVTSAPKIYLFRNLGTGGNVSVSSFASPISISIATIPGGSPNLGELTVADVDSDGRLDIAAVSSSGGVQGYLSVFRNTSTPGSISFASPDFFAYPYYSSQLISTSGDLDGDGRIDFVYTTGTSPGGIWMNQNLSSPGNIFFSYGRSIGTNLSHRDLAIGDLNADGKSELIASMGNAFEIYENNSTPGVIGFNTPFTLTNTSVYNIQIADLDADNKLDLIWGTPGTQYIYFSRNIYSGSVLSASSFDAAIQVANLTGGIEGITVSDINADGKIDVIFTGAYDLGILQNVGSGPLSASSFLASTLFQGSAGGQPITPSAPVSADLDGDNKPEVMFVYTYVNVTAPEKGIYIFRNESYPAPIVNSISPPSGNSGASVALTGNFMFTGNVAPSARFNKINSTVSGSPTNTSTSVINPTGSISGRIAITNHGLTGFSTIFNSTFSTGRVIDATSFGSSIDFALGGNTRDALDVADFDDDGKEDVVVVENFSTGKIFKNTQATAGQSISTSSLTAEATTYGSSYDITTLDIDGDGKVDLNSGFNLFQNTSSGSISFGTGASTNAGGFNYVASGDFNRDGKTDLAVSNGTAFVQIYQNQSSKGTFPPNGNFAPFNSTAINLVKPGNYGGIVAEDFDGDGYDDIVTVTSGTDNFTFYQNLKLYGPIKTSSFSAGTTTATADTPTGLTASDFDGDGKIDLAMSFNSETVTFVSVYRNTSTVGAISFAANVDLPCIKRGYNIASQDLDGDGLAEIVVIHRLNPGQGSFSVLQNKSNSGNVSFNTAVNYPLSLSSTFKPQALAIADINKDEKPDILIVSDQGSSAPANALMVFENKIASGPVITINTQPSDFIACVGDVATFTTAATGTTNITYQWQFSLTGGVGTFTDINNGGGYSNATTSTLSVNTAGNFGAGRYRCKISGDLATTAFTNDEGLFINSIPTAPVTTPDSDCVPASLTLSASGGSNGQYRWYTVATGGTAIVGQTNSAYNTPVISTTTTYYVSLRISSCESARTPVVATIAPIAKPTVFFDPPIFNAGSTINLCEGDLQKFSAPSGFTSYTWSNGEITEEIVVDQSDVYSVVVEDAAGCISPPSDPLTVTINPYPTATITVNDTQLTASTGDSYQWYQNGTVVVGATSQFFEFNILEYGLYEVDVTDNGCTSTSQPFEYLITGIENLKSELKVYPNPITSDEMLVSSPENATLKMFDVLGRKVKEATIVSNSPNIISVHELQAGNYIIAIQSSKTTKRIRIQKVN